MAARYSKLRQRKNSTQRGYDYAWERFRQNALACPQDYGLPTTFFWCQDCLAKPKPEKRPTTEIHHIIRMSVRPDLKYEPSNLMGLCKECHSKRTARGE